MFNKARSDILYRTMTNDAWSSQLYFLSMIERDDAQTKAKNVVGLPSFITAASYNMFQSAWYTKELLHYEVKKPRMNAALQDRETAGKA